MDTILKVECEGDVRRALLTGTPSYAATDAAIQEVWPGRVADGAKYMDDDGDSCTLKQQTFTDFLTTGRETSQGRVLRLRLCPLHGVLDSSVSTAQGLPAPSERVEKGSESDDKGSHHMYTVTDLTDAAAEPLEQENDTQDHRQTPPASSGYPTCMSIATGVLVPPPPTPTALRDQGSDTETAQSRKRASEAKELPQETTHKDTSKKVVGGCQCPMCNPGAAAAESSDDEQEAPSSSMRSKIAALQAVPAALKSRLMESAGKAATASTSAPQEDLFIDLEHVEKIDLVLAAFDESGDGYLNFDELADLNNAAEGDELSLEVYEQMCVNEGEDADVGLGKEALMCIYNRCRSLDMDFNAAKKKLEGALKPCTKRRDSVASSSGTSPKKRDSVGGSSAASPSRPSVINLAETMAHSMDTPTNSPRANAHSMDTPENSPREHVLDEGPSHNLMGQSDSDSEASLGDATAEGQAPGSSDIGVSGGQGGDCVIEHDHAEKIDLVLAAFDTNGDGHLSFDEVVALNSAAESGKLSLEVYTQMCENEGEDPDVGLGKEALMCVYNRCRSIEIDFEAAKAKLEDAASAERTEEKRRESQPLNHLFKNPMLAVPFALDAAERLRNGVAATLNRNRA